MKDFRIQTIRNGKVIDTRPVAALFDRNLWRWNGTGLERLHHQPGRRARGDL